MRRPFRIAMLIVSTIGLAFSGYLSAVKLFTSACAFNESCPYFLGYPACWYGFAMYTIMFLVLVIAVVRKTAGAGPERVVTVVAAIGTLFAGSFAVGEIAAWFGPQGFVPGALGLSTCVYGLAFYLVLLVLGLLSLRRKGGPTSPPPAPGVSNGNGL